MAVHPQTNISISNLCPFLCAKIFYWIFCGCSKLKACTIYSSLIFQCLSSKFNQLLLTFTIYYRIFNSFNTTKKNSPKFGIIFDNFSFLPQFLLINFWNVKFTIGKYFIAFLIEKQNPSVKDHFAETSITCVWGIESRNIWQIFWPSPY